MRQDKFIGKWVFPKSNDLNEQVGRKKQATLEAIVEDISSKLDITEADIILDVCCGNGLITRKIAEKCDKVYGVDFSEILISTVEQESNAENICYYEADALNIGSIFSIDLFDKSYCYFAFQHFNHEKGKELIKLLSEVTRPRGQILNGDIPDKRRRWNYYGYNTFRKRYGYIRRRFARILKGIEGEDALGWWWHPSKIKKICNELSLSCEILEQTNSLPHAHYRFDVLIINTKKV